MLKPISTTPEAALQSDILFGFERIQTLAALQNHLKMHPTRPA